MATAIVHTLKPTRSRVLSLVVLLAILFGCYGLLSAQQARSAAAPAKQVWGGVRANGTIVHQKHILTVTHPSTGQYVVTFDRHVDNCSLEVTDRDQVSSSGFFNNFKIGPGSSTSQVQVFEADLVNNQGADGPFDIFGMCPSI